MPISANLEARLQHELRRKILIVETSKARPSEALIQQRLRTYGDQCYEATTIIKQARHEYASLLHDKQDLFTKRGGAFHYVVKLRQLYATHKQQRMDLVTSTEFFVLAHEWYEILVTVNEVEELSRLEFLRKLGEEVIYEPTEPGDHGYPQPAAVNRSYNREDVIKMIRHQLLTFDVLLDEEKKAVKEAEAETKRNAAVEDAAMHEMRNAFFDLQDEVRRQNSDAMEWMEKTEKTYQEIMAQVTRHAEDSRALLTQITRYGVDNTILLDQLKKQAEDHRDIMERITMITTNKNSQNRGDQREEDNSPGRNTNKRKMPCTDVSDNDNQIKSSILEQHEKELREIEHFLSTNIVRERRSGVRIMKESEGLLKCVYCKETGNHYSDACPEIRFVSDRIRVLKEENRCMICVEHHYGRDCIKKSPCFYCKTGGYCIEFDHHSSICRRPEEFTNTIRRKSEVEMIITMCKDALEGRDRWKLISAPFAARAQSSGQRCYDLRGDEERAHETRRRRSSDEDMYYQNIPKITH